MKYPIRNTLYHQVLQHSSDAGGVKLHRTQLAAAAAAFSIFSRETENGKQYLLLISHLQSFIFSWEQEKIFSSHFCLESGLYKNMKPIKIIIQETKHIVGHHLGFYEEKQVDAKSVAPLWCFPTEAQFFLHSEIMEATRKGKTWFE